MTNRKKIKISIIAVLGLSFLFFVTLVIHIGIMVYGKEQKPFATTQMARVDFKETVNTDQAKHIENQIREFKGVKSTYFNVEAGILIYTFDNKQNTSKNIYNEFKKNSNLLSARHIVSEKDLSQGCPAMNDNTFYGKMTNVVSNIVN